MTLFVILHIVDTEIR